MSAKSRAKSVTQKLIEPHVVSGDTSEPGGEIALAIDQTLTQDATGTLVMLELEALGLEVAQTELSCQYVDHNLVQEDHKNADDHLFLLSACERFGFWFSRAGNGVSHPVHMERFGRPGATLLGSDSHTPAAGALGMLAIGAGGSDVAMAVAGFPFHLEMPEIWGVELTNELPAWVSAKDVVLEMLRRHGVRGGRGRVIEYFGDGLSGLGAMDRHVIANMGTELGATSTVFPADGEVEKFLREQGRESDWRPIQADEGATYDVCETIDLASLEPLIAMPSSPDHVRPVREVEGEPIYQAYLGSSANPGFRDFAIPALMVEGKKIHDGVSFDVSPTSRRVLTRLIEAGHLSRLLDAGARLHQAGCNGCIGMGQAPASGKLSLRTVPRNFPGRSGTKDDRVCLASPETVTASALRGRISDPRTMDADCPELEAGVADVAGPPPVDLIKPPPPRRDGVERELVRGPNIVSLPELEPLPESMTELPILLKVGDDLSTDAILPAGTRVLPLRSNIPAISRFCFEDVDETYPERALFREGEKQRDDGGTHGGRPHAIVAGHNYGQGSSREHAALAPRYLGLRVVVAKSFARIHRQNLVNFGVLPLTLVDEAAYAAVEPDDTLTISNVMRQLETRPKVEVVIESRGERFEARHELTRRQLDVVGRGGLIGWARDEMKEEV